MKRMLWIVGMGQAVAVGASGILTNSSILSAFIGGLFLVANGLLTVMLTRKPYHPRPRPAQRADRRRATPPRRQEDRQNKNRRLEIVSVVTSVCAIGALVWALSLFGTRLNFVQKAREDAAVDNCYILRALVVKAGAPRPQILLKQVGLGNCQQYGRAVRAGKR